MAKKKNKSDRPPRPWQAGPGEDANAPAGPPQGVIPTAPPMADGRPRWPLYLALAIFALWLAALIFLAMHSIRWAPAGN